ncbi:hypothetical protein RUM44_000781 [Polyplax serrata]|uniref:Uncharacterized protein n=1 Tax=Polyplax serrata TaxID=468196 RepID=A0ABR1B8M0_POLSC
MLNFLNVIPQGHEKALKQAFYNAIALFVLFLCTAGGWALFYILEPFVKPLVWAVLIGSVLHPFKYSLAKHFELWFHQVNASSNFIYFGVFMIPIHLMDRISEAFSTFILIYITALIFYWNEENKELMSVASYVVWFIISLFSARIFGILRIPFLIFILFALSFGFAYEVFTVLTLSCERISCWKAVKNVFKGNVKNTKHDNERGNITSDAMKSEQKNQAKSVKEEIETTFTKKPSLLRSSSDNMEKLDLFTTLNHQLSVKGLTLESSHKNTGTEESSKYIYGVIWSCVLMMIWKNLWIVQLLPIPIAIYFIKHLGLYFGFWGLLSTQLCSLMGNITPFIKARQSAIFPPPIQGLCKVQVLNVTFYFYDPPNMTSSVAVF